ncbi:hypothetical protein A8W25_28410 [Streptomyces sp. ERV7]|uniref:hypothetical protein n=1 Tax=Streptomyces sp. ERV7 TaxID=1322334 RepID=UPI0007F3C70B|nr:hypothetical protein [Streptomyces sp. ERV7]OAR26588.1 hypothetical protein A8W25_28410 [Streptomyces sp. ERV7]
MNARGAPIRIARQDTGEVEVNGSIDELARLILDRAGFLFRPTVSGVWIRLPFDTGQANENRQATHAARMLSAAGYQVDLDPALLPAAGHPEPVNGWPHRTMTAPLARPARQGTAAAGLPASPASGSGPRPGR